MCRGVKGTAGGVTFTGKVSISGNVRPFLNEAEFLQQKSTNVFPPVMSYYEPNKFTVSGANFINTQREQFRTVVANADRIAIVGARVHAPDTHIWEPLSTTRAIILYVSGTTGGESCRQWADRASREGDVVLESYFRESMGEILEFMA